MSQKLISIILVNYNCIDYVSGLFDSLSKQTLQDYEILMFNNKSEDGSLEKIKDICPHAKIFEMDENTGFSKPNNEGIRRSKGEYILCLNFDIILENDFLEQMVNSIEQDPRIGWVAGKMLRLTPAGKSVNIDCLGHHMTKSRYAVERDYSKPFSWDDYTKSSFVFGASACAALYRKEMLQDIAIDGEYFDEDFFAYFEDVDLDWRAQLRNWRCQYSPEAVGYHARYGTGLINNAEIAGCLLSNRIFMMIKNESIKHVLEDIQPIILRTFTDYKGYSKHNSRAVFVAIKRLLTLIPKMYKKRRYIQQNKSVTDDYIRNLIK